MAHTSHNITPATATDAQIRAWAVANGLEKSGSRGRMSTGTVLAFAAAFVAPATVPAPPAFKTVETASETVAETVVAQSPAKDTTGAETVVQRSLMPRGTGQNPGFYVRLLTGENVPVGGIVAVAKSKGGTAYVRVLSAAKIVATKGPSYRVADVEFVPAKDVSGMIVPDAKTAYGAGAVAVAASAAPVATAPVEVPAFSDAPVAKVTRATAPVATVTARIEAVVDAATRTAKFVVITATGSRIVCESLADAETIAAIVG